MSSGSELNIDPNTGSRVNEVTPPLEDAGVAAVNEDNSVSSSFTQSMADKEEWEDMKEKAGVPIEKSDKHGWMHHAQPYIRPIKDHLYSLIEPPSRDEDKPQLFGLAKAFPQVTRRGYQAHLYETLKEKAEKKGVTPQDVEKDIEQGKSHVHTLRLKDFGIFYRLKTRFHAELAEFLGMFVSMCIGYGSSCQYYLGSPNYSSWTNVTFTWGFGSMAGIYVAGGYSGAHLNPIVTLNLWFFRGFPFRRMFSFWLAQLLGAVAAAAWIFILYYPLLRAKEPHGWTLKTASVFYASMRNDIPVATGWFNEVTASTVLHIIIFAVGDSHNIAPARGMNALVLGFTTMAMGSSFGYLSAFGLNPFRDIGPRLFLSMVGVPNTMWTEKDAWFVTGEWTGPLLGGLMGGFAYDSFLFDGPESPINFPPKIKRRAIKFFFDDIIHPFSGQSFARFRRGGKPDPNLTGKVRIPGQPAGQKPL